MGGKKLLKKAKKLAKKAARKVANDPQVRELARNTASQLKQQLLGGIRAEMSAYTGGRITGSGDGTYKTSSNLYPVGARVKREVGKSVVIEREEFIAPVVSHTTAKGLTITKYRYNPASFVIGNEMARTALGFEHYEPLQITIIYDSTSGDALNSTDSSLGKVCLAAQYNTFARDWDSFVELENAADSVCGAPSENLALLVECKPSRRSNRLYLVSETDPNSAAKPFYDHCDFYVASVGLQGQAVRIGDLKIRHKVRFSDPVYRDTTMPDVVIFATGSVASANDPLSTTPTVTENATTRLGCTLAWTTTTLTITNLKPFVGRVRLQASYAKLGSSVASREAPSAAFTGTALGTAVTVANDVLTLDVASQTNAGNTSSALYLASKVYPVETDKIVITFSGGAGNASDTYRFMVSMMAAELSDF
jgi:hypothetical protein